MQAADLMVALINQTKDSIVIHDDGNDSAMSVSTMRGRGRFPRTH